jgi:N-acylneuraminate cytidylyltransferase
VVAVVPARAGSRGLAGKNLRTVGGQSLVERAVRAAREAGIDRVVVTTDGPDIAAEAERLGCTTVSRPAELAGDTSRTVDAVVHAVRALGLPDDAWVVLLQPTSPLRTAQDVVAALERHAAGDAGTTLTGCVVEHHPLKQLLVDPSGEARPVRDWPDLEAPRQVLPLAVRPNGAVYVTAVGSLLGAGSVIVPPVAVVQMPEERSIDVDDAAALARARASVGDEPGDPEVG